MKRGEFLKRTAAALAGLAAAKSLPEPKTLLDDPEQEKKPVMLEWANDEILSTSANSYDCAELAKQWARNEGYRFRTLQRWTRPW